MTNLDVTGTEKELSAYIVPLNDAHYVSIQTD